MGRERFFAAIYSAAFFGLIFWCVQTVPSQADILHVGPNHPLKYPSHAARIAKDGDLILIDAGHYDGDIAVFTQNRLTIKAINGMAHIKAPKRISNGKAIWIIKGSDVWISNIHFSGAHVPDRNGAGIRHVGGKLTISNCHFTANQIGLLSYNNMKGDIHIQSSRFANNRLKDDTQINPGHNVYIGRIGNFVIEDSIIFGAHIGHQVKSRAARSIIRRNRIFDEKPHVSSYLIDLPNGGDALIEDNDLYQGPDAVNYTMISYGAERRLHHKNALIIQQNKFKNDASLGLALHNHTDVVPRMDNNSLDGVTLQKTGELINKVVKTLRTWTEQ
ncbi:MAG: hypothetical protein CMF31_02910 [Kordiimonas sp.]|nr:hypothetical protein [Kordiimonas sp.]|tara:strand:+ start:1316 stop:2308 length:993 start_codon:yes stop_codon:yes gene_type:complete